MQYKWWQTLFFSLSSPPFVLSLQLLLNDYSFVFHYGTHVVDLIYKMTPAIKDERVDILNRNNHTS